MRRAGGGLQTLSDPNLNRRDTPRTLAEAEGHEDDKRHQSGKTKIATIAGRY